MRIDDLDYTLPEDRIAQYPADPRDEARLLVLDRDTRALTEDRFINIGEYLETGDCLVFNDTKVIRARLTGTKVTGGHVEILLLRELEGGAWEALVRPSARVKPGASVHLPAELKATVGAVLPGGKREVTFDAPDVITRLEEAGAMPLPPYINRPSCEPLDIERYQTIFARSQGAVAAPTAGLHYTGRVFERLAQRGVRRAFLTLHVGYGTFKPIQADNLEEHTVDPEEFTLTEETAATLNATRSSGGRIVAVGTTATRVLESCWRDGEFQPGAGETGLYIRPSYTFRAVDALQTNFHLPRSSLLALVMAFAGRDPILESYRYAIDHGFRFYSYGDTMLIR